MLLPLKYFDVYQLPVGQPAYPFQKNSNYNSFQSKINAKKNKVIFITNVINGKVDTAFLVLSVLI